MPLGIVSDEDFELEISKNSIPTPLPTIKKIDRGRGEGNVEVPDSLRKVIGDTAITDGRQEALALGKQFGISPSSVSAYSHGSTSTASYDSTPNLPTINGAKLRVQNKARRKLMAALNHITPDKLADAKLTEVSGVARDMAAIVKAMEPDTPKSDSSNDGKPPVQFVFFAPPVKKEEVFDVVFAKE